LKIEKLSETDKADATKQEKKEKEKTTIYRGETEKNLLLRLLL
jgi:hypothetical protein